MSTNWKNIGKNSGNMSSNRNIISNKISYSSGNVSSVFDISGQKHKGYIFDVSGDNIVLGVGTSAPFSRLSLGNNINSVLFNPNEPGQLASIALNEENNGSNFTGLFYSKDIQKYSATTKTEGIQFVSNIGNFDVNSEKGGKIVLANDGVVTIGGNATMNSGVAFSNIVGQDINDTTGQTKIILDVKGSIKTNGYINFVEQQTQGTSSQQADGATFVPNGSFWDTSNLTRSNNIPRGSLFVIPRGGANQEGVYYKDCSGNLVFVGGQTQTITADPSGAFIFDLKDEDSTKAFITTKSNKPLANVNSVGGVNVLFSGEIMPKPNDGTDFNNTLTIRAGNFTVTGISSELIAKTTDGSPLTQSSFLGNADAGLPYSNDISGGVIWSQRQICIGPNKYNKNWGVLDLQTVQDAPAFLSYNLKKDKTVFKPKKATNSIILIHKDEDDDGISSDLCSIGTTFDCSNSIIFGERFINIDTPNSLISNSKGSTSKITDSHGSNIVFGKSNILANSPYSIIMGANNNIDNENNNLASINSGGGNFMLGKDNEIYNKTSTSQSLYFNSNVTIGQSNKSGYTHHSFIQGNLNKSIGSHNIIFGNNNITGPSTVNFDFTDSKNYKSEGTFIQGSDNTIFAPYNKTVYNNIILGKNNTLDLSFNTFIDNQEDGGQVLLGNNAVIEFENINANLNPFNENVEDVSNVKLAFGTYQKFKYNKNIATNIRTKGNRIPGNVFTIDGSGNTHIYGNIIIDGNISKIYSSQLDISGIKINLNTQSIGKFGAPGSNVPNEGGLYLSDLQGSGEGNDRTFTWSSRTDGEGTSARNEFSNFISLDPTVTDSDNYWSTYLAGSNSKSDLKTNRLYADKSYSNYGYFKNGQIENSVKSQIYTYTEQNYFKNKSEYHIPFAAHVGSLTAQGDKKNLEDTDGQNSKHYASLFKSEENGGTASLLFEPTTGTLTAFDINLRQNIEFITDPVNNIVTPIIINPQGRTESNVDIQNIKNFYAENIYSSNILDVSSAIINDISVNDISANDISVNDISANNSLYAKNVYSNSAVLDNLSVVNPVSFSMSGTKLFINKNTGDISSNDISCNDISANSADFDNIFVKNLNITTGKVNINDISSNSLSFNGSGGTGPMPGPGFIVPHFIGNAKGDLYDNTGDGPPKDTKISKESGSMIYNPYSNNLFIYNGVENKWYKVLLTSN
tara:strand:+ start:456 stop:4031 length:3576 start_codon:yes stop_codon:yes gene_type:complete